MQDETASLRIGILLREQRRFENWELRLFEKLLADSRFELTAFIIEDRPPATPEPTRLYDLVSYVDNRLFARQPRVEAPLFRSREALIERLPVTQVDAQALDRLHLDLVLRHEPGLLPDTIVAALPFGVWALSFADTHSRKADWTAFADSSSHAPVTNVSLRVRCRGQARPKTIASAAYNTKFSAARNAAFVKEKAVILLMRELRRLADTRSIRSEAIGTVTPGIEAPHAGEIGAYILKTSWSAATRLAKSAQAKLGLRSAMWTLYSGYGGVDDFDPAKTVEIPPTPDSIKADPFLFQHAGENYVFYENYTTHDKRAHIAVGRLEGNRIEPLGKALQCDYHLSFPFVFSHGDDIYMMPESHQARRLEIWRCVEFPLKWTLHATALDGLSPVDSTMFQHQGKWWLLTNLSDHHAFEDHCSELYVFQVDGPALKSVVPHKTNPVVIGSAIARNAGRVVSRNGRLYRPSQNNSRGIYGFGLNIMEIEQLDLETYRERMVRTLTPDFKKGLCGCHHFDAAGGRFILDARMNH
ncbi:hypothetical protein EET67_01305 [Pseudaminobacter arsenicus]|uniref:Glucosamine inositolphosphorylceramide transferase 1 N-terminal domain-containing protein n=1 Tax=Borborobacter arsenicus TaxID=1851146 RepID=A0A432VBQ1_9HYPH|nr:hypothetical protein [Pseudaminobacter arsenicus]RUM99564.1 hypothetical protein EET67_01305 [Pseudaminobacter arsenicus]